MRDRGWIPAPVSEHEGRLCAGMTAGGEGWHKGERAVAEPPLQEDKMGPRIREDTEGEHPHPFDRLRAGSNLPPSRGKGFAVAERVIFIVITIARAGRGFLA